MSADQIHLLSKESLDITEKTSNLYLQLIPEVGKNGSLTQEIASASTEQNQGIEQVNNAIQQLNSITQQNASSSEEVASNAVELAEQAERLLELISFFKTNIAVNTPKKQVKTISNAPIEMRKTERFKPEEKSNLSIAQEQDDKYFESF